MSARARMMAGAARAALVATAAVAALALTSGPSAAQGGAAGAAPAPAGDQIAKGRDLFANYGCGSCHTLADAGATGHVGPSLDGDTNLTQAFVVDRVTNGQGAMPAFAGQMTPAEIAAVAAYVTKVASK